MPLTTLIAFAALGQVPTASVHLSGESIVQPLGAVLQISSVSKGQKIKTKDQIKTKPKIKTTSKIKSVKSIKTIKQKNQK